MYKGNLLESNSEKVVLFDGRVIECRLKPEHRIVWQGLEAANLLFNRTVFVGEIVETLTNDEKRLLQDTYVKKLEEAIAVVLELLAKRGLVLIKKGDRFRHYASLRILDPTGYVSPDEPKSTRQAVLDLVYEAVAFYKRAIRAKDLIEFAQENSAAEFIDQVVLARNLKGLSDSGELKIVGTIRGDGGGSNLYLPSELNYEEYLPDDNLTWLELVAKFFLMLWQRRIRQATNENRLPVPISTAEIRDYLESDSDPHPRLKERKAVTNALKSLSETKNPTIRRIKIRATGAVLWVPKDVNDHETNLCGGHDSNKIITAVKRAEKRLDHPVSVGDITDEIKLDPLLIPTARQSVSQILNNLSKTKIANTKGTRRERVLMPVKWVGSSGGRAYYVTEKYDIEKAYLYLEYLRCKERWEILIASESIDTVENVQLPSVKTGRTLLLLKEAESFRQDFFKLLSNQKTDWKTRRHLELMLRQSEQIVINCRNWLKNNNDESFPSDVSNFTQGLSSVDLIEIYRPLYPIAAELKDANHMIILCSKFLRRIPNKAFRSRFSSNSEETTEYLLDRADALIFAAIKWGIGEGRCQALIARHELNTLRDERFVLPALKSADYQERMRAVACLAFLQTKENNEILYRVLQDDPVTDVRLSALWAFIFSGGESAVSMLEKIVQTEKDERIINLASAVIQSGWNKIWFL